MTPSWVMMTMGESESFEAAGDSLTATAKTDTISNMVRILGIGWESR